MQDKWLRLPLAAIAVPRRDRQRRLVRDQLSGEFLNPDGLLESIRARGVMNAIIVKEEQPEFPICDLAAEDFGMPPIRQSKIVLVAGERRLEASRELGLPDIPVRFTTDIDPQELQVIELEENLKRTDLPWQDQCAAIARLHELYLRANPSHTQAATEAAIGLSQISETLRVARELGDPRIAACTRLREAYNILARKDERGVADAVNDIIDASAAIFGPDGSGGSSGEIDTADLPTAVGGSSAASAISTVSVSPPEPPPSILHADFHAWAATYSGPTFNFIHCDFPYGIEAFAGAQSGRDRHGTTYDDSAEVYLELIQTLCRSLPRLMSHSAHLMFWLTADIYIQHRTLEIFRELAPALAFSFKPLLWHKTDNVGILADPRRGPRHVYETAIFASQEDRLIARAVSDVYGAPTDKSHHPSTKPEPMLRHFFQMFVDENSRVFDPTCGSGAALRAAESLGAPTVLGLESDREHFEAAQTALRTFRALRRAAR